MENQGKNKFVEIIRENRVLVVIGLVFITISILLFWLGGRSDKTTPTGDLPSKDSPAFMVYKDDTYRPFGSNAVDNLIRADLAYFARNQMEEYNPDKNPGVVFEVKKFEKDGDNKISITGKYELVKGDVKITAERLKYDRANISISWKNISIDDQLPSADERNKFVGTLPIEKGVYSIRFQTLRDVIVVTFMPGYTVADVDEAEKIIKDGLPEEDARKVVYSINARGSFTPDFIRREAGKPIPNPPGRAEEDEEE